MTGPIKQRGNPLISLLIIGGLVAILLACSLGETPMRPLDLLRAMTGSGDPANSVIVWSIRLPRALAAWMVGAALGLSGAALQIGAVLGALFATGVIALAARGLGDTVSLILIGVGLSSLGGALVSLALNLAPNPFTLNDMVSWMMGSVANRSFADIGLSGPIIAVGAALILATRRGLSALTLGEETAHGLGLDLVRTRLLVTVGCGLAAGGSVALAGAIGFVGIITPHLVRPWVGGDPGRALVPSALAGGVLLVFADMGARLVPSDNELKLGVVAALIGAPVFLWIAARRRRNGLSA